MKSIRVKKNFIFKRIMSFILALCLMLPLASEFSPVREVEAARLLRLSTAKSVSIANSDKIESLEIQIEAKEAGKDSAIRSIRERYISNRTFRYSPLLSFKFPTTPDEAEEFEYMYKPIQIEYDVETLKHKMTEAKLDENEKVSNIYIDIITAQAEVDFLKGRIDNMRQAVSKNEARLMLGEATQDQVDMQKKKLEGFESSLATQESKLQRAKEKLGKELGFSVTTGYRFEEAFVSSSIDRETISYLQAYALERDHTVFEARQTEELARLALMTNYELCKHHYGSDIYMISQYIQDALDGSKINKRSFKKQYDAFLKKIDEPWQGSYKILFFSFPKEWFKGDTDGIRYVQDDPYVLYSAALDYESALKDYNNACDELRDSIEEGYDTFIEARKNYITAQTDIVERREQLLIDEAKNALGQLSLDEYETENSEYEDSRSALKDALSTYSSTLYSYDRTTCGGLSAYLREESLSSQTGRAGTGGLAAPEPSDGLERELADMSAIIKKGMTYSIKSIVDTQEFMLYIDVPEGFETQVTDFELWADGRQIGNRVAVGESIRHLTLSVTDVSTVFVRLYNGDEKVDDCSIDPNLNYGPLNLTTGYEEPAAPEQIIGTYTVDEDNTTDMIKMRFTFDQNAVQRLYQLGSPVYYYNMSAEQNLYLFSDDLISAETPFSYMSFIKNDIGALTIRLFDEEGNYIGGAYFNTANQTMYVDKDVTEQDMQVLAARKLLIAEKTEELQAELNRMKELLQAAELAGGQTDSATIQYYKDRIAELEEMINNVADTITDEDVQDAISNRADEVNEIAETLRPVNGATDEDGEPVMTLSDAEKQARAQILETTAVDFIKKLRTDEMREALQKSITDKEKQIADKNRKYREALQDGDNELAEKLKKEMEALQKEIDNEKKKQSLAGSDIGDITPEDIENALKEFENDIYADAAEQLTDPMLYGTPAGQWAKNYLETHGMEVTPENMRLVVGRADNIETYEKMLERKNILDKEVEDAKAKLEKLREGTSVAEQSLADQMEKIIDAYEKELETLDADTLKTDPGSAIKANELRNRIAALRKEINDSRATIAGLICVTNPDRDVYVGNALASKRTAAETQYNKTVEEADAALKQFTKEIDTYQAKVDIMNGNAEMSQEDITRKEREYTGLIDSTKLVLGGLYETKSDLEDDLDWMESRYFRFFWEASIERDKRKLQAVNNEINYQLNRLSNLESNLADFRNMYQDVVNASASPEASQEYVEENETMIENSAARYETLKKENDAKIAAAKAAWDEIQAEYDEMALDWNNSYAEKLRLEGIIAEDEAAIPGLQQELLKYE